MFFRITSMLLPDEICLGVKTQRIRNINSQIRTYTISHENLLKIDVRRIHRRYLYVNLYVRIADFLWRGQWGVSFLVFFLSEFCSLQQPAALDATSFFACIFPRTCRSLLWPLVSLILCVHLRFWHTMGRWLSFSVSSIVATLVYLCGSLLLSSVAVFRTSKLVLLSFCRLLVYILCWV